MTGRLAAIWRHPIKAHGRETLRAVRLTANSTMPWDRTWAVAHEAAKLRGQDWVPCANFTRGAKVPALMALTATLDTADEMVTLRHPDLSALRFAPDREAGRWLARCRRCLRLHVGIGLHSLVCRPAAITITATHVDLRQAIDAVDLRVRRAGLDIDPGWVPWLGRVLRFHYGTVR